MPSDSKQQFVFCNLLNESICSVTEELKSDVHVTVYNPIAWKRSHSLRLPVTRKDIIGQFLSLFFILRFIFIYYNMI